MKTWGVVSAGVVAVLVLWAGGAPAQSGPPCDSQGNVTTPPKVEGQVVKIDTVQSTVTVQGPDGKTFQFHASKETLQDLKVGDRIEAKLRSAPRC